MVFKYQGYFILILISLCLAYQRLLKKSYLIKIWMEFFGEFVKAFFNLLRVGARTHAQNRIKILPDQSKLGFT